MVLPAVVYYQFCFSSPEALPPGCQLVQRLLFFHALTPTLLPAAVTHSPIQYISGMRRQLLNCSLAVYEALAPHLGCYFLLSPREQFSLTAESIQPCRHLLNFPPVTSGHRIQTGQLCVDFPRQWHLIGRHL